jgi:chromosome segregation protein
VEVKLKRIELLGFKSFAKKSRLDFDVPVVGVVGPNGSGKSNIVEAFRFVLGEQSMKSLRGKSGSDLIFKGSKDLPKGNRASVEITFDNRDRVFKMSERSEPLNLDFDEIILKREVFADGNNIYYINNTAVRLKDIVEMLASVNIGASGHHIISQGQADRILTSSAKDRRQMIEDALGLKVYQNKLKDSNKKLEKTKENMKEVGLLRRELAPHIKYLKKQVEKVEKSVELRAELSKLYLQFFKSEEEFLKAEEAHLKTTSHEKERELREIEIKLASIRHEDGNQFEDAKNAEIANLQKEISALEHNKDELSRKLGRIEGMIEFQTKSTQATGPENISIKSSEFESFVSDIERTIDRSLNDPNIESIRAALGNIKNALSAFAARFKSNKAENVQVNSFKDLEVTKRDVSAQLESIEEIKNGLVEKVAALRSAVEVKRSEAFKGQEEKYLLETKKNKIVAEEELRRMRSEAFHKRKYSFEESIKEAVVLVGREILDYGSTNITPSNSGDDLHHNIERLKIKLEDAGTGGGEDVMKEYNEITERDQFLSKELEDLEKSINNLRTLIDDLKETLDREFREGLEKINARFEEFFKLMFGGGAAYLSSIVQEKRANDLDDDIEEDSPSSTLGTNDQDRLDYGIDINVTLPQKKVKDLAMLSGGERSLTSIALVFAMTQVNPPPFLVLDETDAALDEANSKRYGDMIEILSKYSSLITVTHNRETMSRADVIYGVTIGADGGSKLLSIKFSDAENYAK